MNTSCSRSKVKIRMRRATHELLAWTSIARSYTFKIIAVKMKKRKRKFAVKGNNGQKAIIAKLEVAVIVIRTRSVVGFVLCFSPLLAP